LTLIVAVAPSVGAQESPPYPLGEVVISDSRPASELSAAVRVVSANEIAASGVHTLAEAIALLPGISVRTGGEGVPRLDLRGLRTRHLLVLLDGIPLNSTFDGQTDPSLIPAEDIALIKVM